MLNFIFSFYKSRCFYHLNPRLKSSLQVKDSLYLHIIFVRNQFGSEHMHFTWFARELFGGLCRGRKDSAAVSVMKEIHAQLI